MDVTVDGLTGTNLQVEVDDAELFWPLIEITEEGGIHVVYASKGIAVIFPYIKVGIWTFHLARLNVGPPYQTHVVIEEQITNGLSLRDNQSGGLTPSKGKKTPWKRACPPIRP